MTARNGTITRLEAVLLLGVLGAVFAWSAWRPHDRLTWYLEVAPVVIGLPLVLFSAKRFPLTPLLYRLLLVHAVILLVGGHYTYARVPLGAWAQEAFELSRNHYDRLGHVAQGFVPAILAREVLIRLSPVRSGGWLILFVIAVCLAFSAFYEMIEWWAAIIEGSEATAFLATQGDPWDTQWDMFLALTGAIAALATLSRVHDRQLERLLGGLN